MKYYSYLLAGVLLLLMTACQKNDTRFYEDAEAAELSIFSNTGNNVMSCYVNNIPWRTVDRTYSYFLIGSTTKYEVQVNAQAITAATQSVALVWNGYYIGNTQLISTIVLRLTLPGRSLQQAINTLQGQRLRVDTIGGNGFSASDVYNLPNLNSRRTGGSIYFQTASVDSVAPFTYRGKIAGVWEADFGTAKIIKGRFDHDLVAGQFR